MIKWVVVPLSPPAEKQMVTKPTKFNDLVGFFVYGIPNMFIKYQCSRCLLRCHLFFKKLSDTYQKSGGLQPVRTSSKFKHLV